MARSNNSIYDRSPSIHGACCRRTFSSRLLRRPLPGGRRWPTPSICVSFPSRSGFEAKKLITSRITSPALRRPSTRCTNLNTDVIRRVQGMKPLYSINAEFTGHRADCAPAVQLSATVALCRDPHEWAHPMARSAWFPLPGLSVRSVSKWWPERRRHASELLRPGGRPQPRCGHNTSDQQAPCGTGTHRLNAAGQDFGTVRMGC